MNLTGIRIKNFRSLESVELKGLRQFNVLIGKNNSGKSSFFAALRFLADIVHARPVYALGKNIITDFSKELALEIGLSFQPSEQERKMVISRLIPNRQDKHDIWKNSAFCREMNVDFQSKAGNPESLIPTKIEIKTVQGKMVNFATLTRHDGSQGFSMDECLSPDELDSHWKDGQVNEYQIQNIMQRSSGPLAGTAFVGQWGKEIGFGKSTWPLFLVSRFLAQAFFFEYIRRFDSDQNVGGNGNLDQDGRNLVQVLHYWLTNDRDRFDRIQRFVQRAFNSVGGLETPFNRQHQKDGNNIQATFRSIIGGNQIPLQHMGGGVAQFLMAAVALETTTSDIPIFMEEPETNLHPRAQRFLAERLTQEKRQIFITTHSPTFINLPRQKSVHKISMSNGRTNVVSLDDDTLHVALNEIGARNSDVLLSDAVVFVEGESDLRVFQEWCRLQQIELAGTNTAILPMHSLGRPEVGLPIRSQTLKTIAVNAQIPHLFILDADELSDPSVRKLQKELGQKLQILKKRELENYLLNARAMKEAINEKLSELNAPAVQIEEKEIDRLIKEAAENMKGMVFIKRIRSLLEAPAGGFFPREIFEEMESIAGRKSLAGLISKKLQKYYADHLSKLKIDTLVVSTRKKFDKDWKSAEKRLSIAPGTELIEDVFKHFKLNYNKTTDAPRIAKNMRREDLEPEIVQLLELIQNMTSDPLNTPAALIR